MAKTRHDYDRCLENFLAAKSKVEQQQQQSNGVVNPRRLDEARERYHKCCRKLHLTHNDYVLLLCEASEFERDMRTILLPGLLEHQQAIQEDMVDKWKIILQEVQRCVFQIVSVYLYIIKFMACVEPDTHVLFAQQCTYFYGNLLGLKCLIL